MSMSRQVVFGHNYKDPEKVEKVQGVPVYAGGKTDKATKELKLHEMKNGEFIGNVNVGLTPRFGIKDETGKTVYPRVYGISPKKTEEEKAEIRAKKAATVDKEGNPVTMVEADALFLAVPFFAKKAETAPAEVAKFKDIMELCKPKFENNKIVEFPLNVVFTVSETTNGKYVNKDIVAMEVQYNDDDPKQVARVEKMLEIAKGLPRDFDAASLEAFQKEHKARWYAPEEYSVPTPEGGVKVVKNEAPAPAAPSHDGVESDFNFEAEEADAAPSYEDADIPF